MSLKFLALITVTLCGLLIGLEFKRRLSIRVQSLEMFRSLFLEMKSMIAHSGMTLDDMIWNISDRRGDNGFLHQMSEYISENSFREAWKRSLHERQNELCLTEDDLRMLTDCAEMLGKSDIEGELQALALIDERVTRTLGEARDKLNADGKVYVTMGGSCGVILALLLL